MHDTLMFPTHDMQHPDDDGRLKHSLSVNQVVVRVAGEPLGLEAGSRHVKEESYQPCGLHVDAGDVPHARGSPLIYSYVQQEGAAQVDGRPLKKNDLMVFIIQYLRAGFPPLHAPGGGVAMPSLSESNLDLKRGCLMWVYITFDFAVQSVKLCQGKAY